MTDKFYSISDVELTFGTEEKQLDYSNYERLQASISQNLKKVGREEALERRKEATRTWLASVPKRWRDSSVKNSKNFEQLKALLSKNKLHSFYLYEDPTEGLQTAYGLLRVFVSRGWVNPTQIAVVSGSEIDSAAIGGFEGANFLRNLMRNKIFLITTSEKQYLSEKERTAWSKIISQCFNEGKTLVLVGDMPLRSFLSSLESPALEVKTKELFGENVIEKKNQDVDDRFSDFSD